MAEPKRIQRQRTKGWRMPEGAVNVTRPTDWSNPYKVGEKVAMLDGSFGDMPILDVTITPELAVALFRVWLAEHPWLDQIRAELGGKDLACWCRLGQPCHADVLLELANGGTDG